MRNFEQPDVSPVEEQERKNQVKRENRLKKIVERNLERLQFLFPKEADDFEITYEEIQETENSIFKGKMTKF